VEGSWQYNAIMCTADSAVQRPTMAAVVPQLKESLALKEAHAKACDIMVSPGSGIVALVSEFGPRARWTCICVLI
jgi:hypothetical protein